MKRIIWLLFLSLFVSGCTSLKTPEIKGVVVDAETGKPIEGARIYAKWQKTVSGPGGQTGGAIAKELRLQVKEDGRFAMPAYTLRNYIPYPFGQGGTFYMVIYAHGYMYKSFTFNETSKIEQPKYDEFKNTGDNIKSKILLTKIKNENEFDNNITYIKDIRDFHFIIDEYRQFLKLFPESHRIPSIHIYTAFIYWSELKDYHAALKEYEIVLRNYPDYKLSSETKMEIEWVKNKVR